MNIQETIGNTPLIQVPVESQTSVVLAKCEGNNPGGSIKDRAALKMINDAEERGQIRKGDTLIEATSGNTGIALSMVASIKGYKIIIIMPETVSSERIKTMKVYGAEVILVSKEEDMEGARDLATKMSTLGQGLVLDQFSNPSNYMAHFETTGPEIWEQTEGKITHFVSAMGTTGTITGVSMFLKSKNKDIRIIGVQPEDGSRIPGIRRWSEGYEPEIRKNAIIDDIIDINQLDAEETSKELAEKNGIFCGVSAAANINISRIIANKQSDAKVVTILCDRGDRYLSKL
ncbi:MAG: cysteine synthase CysM [Gammaproteobacteria bacterium]|nr:cysteine synthase CysM [Gammaproteobacteria bacterium]|tara:strand:+ start:26541 stop:27404 length:864 start_codon:yes stop_codon:yes gene_type:complete